MSNELETDASAPGSEVNYPPPQRRRPRIIPSRSDQPQLNRYKSVRLVHQLQSTESKCHDQYYNNIANP